MSLVPSCWFLALGVVCACGARVNFDPNGEEGGGGGTVLGAGGAGGGAAPAESACNDWCERNKVACNDTEACVARCEEAAGYLGSCIPAFEAMLSCDTEPPPPDPAFCRYSEPSCQAELDALVACVYPAGPCGQGECVAGSGTGDPAMECTVACGGVTFIAACNPVTSGSFPYTCTCLRDGITLGSCQALSGDGFGQFGCCSGLFAETQ